MTTFTPPTEASDADLVARSLQGDREAYAAIVRRYQSLICSLTYSACGDRHQSEDLAQETFLAAWKCLPELNDPAHLRPWLRGIARNITHNALRKRRRIPTPLPDDTAAALLTDPTPAPPDAAITHEEQTLLWQTLSRLPEDYREPLVLFYRQQQSVSAVAAAFDLTEEAARQRLSRGRAMLARRLEHLIDRGLRQSAPGPAFTLTVTASLPAVALPHTTTALTATAVKTTAAASTFLGPLLYVASMCLGYRIGLEQTIAPEERRFLRRFSLVVLLIALAFTAVLLATIYAARRSAISHSAFTGLLAAITTLYVFLIFTASLLYTSRIRRLRAHLTGTHPHLQAEAHLSAQRWHIHYRSPRRLLGLPLLHVNIGSTPDLRPLTAKGWVAIGTVAYSPLLALGTIAIAPVSWGAFSLGLLTYGALAVGLWSVGVLAIGHNAIGVCALATHAAQGIVALAPTYASGISAAAIHANDPAADAFFQSDPLFRTWTLITDHPTWLWLICAIPLLIVLRRFLRLRSTR